MHASSRKSAARSVGRTREYVAFTAPAAQLANTACRSSDRAKTDRCPQPASATAMANPTTIHSAFIVILIIGKTGEGLPSKGCVGRHTFPPDGCGESRV